MKLSAGRKTLGGGLFLLALRPTVARPADFPSQKAKAPGGTGAIGEIRHEQNSASPQP